MSTGGVITLVTTVTPVIRDDVFVKRVESDVSRGEVDNVSK